MEDCILIADSGSTKTDWIITGKKYGIREVGTSGINPVRDSQDTIFRVLKEELLANIPADCNIKEIFFYGAGCISPYKEVISLCMRELLPEATAHVESDLLGAAKALCGNEAGIACILGTGSNSCLYNGKEIIANVSPLGFILGDEGSGAVLGRTLVNYILKASSDTELRERFLCRFSLTQQDIIENVYKKPMPNKFLASLVPFLYENRTEPGLHNLLVDSFCQFFQKNIKAYNHPEMKVNFVGSIAFFFYEELEEAATKEGYLLGKIIRQPAHEIANFHTK